jgi:membrane-anchored protein YejM (alkaline phosphatase superfamily)
MVGQYRVPLVIYSPVMKFPPLNKVTQHSDIPKTILDLVGVEGGDMPMVGASVFSKDSGLAINLADGRTYFMVTDDKVHTLDQAGNGNLLQIDWETGRLETVQPERNPELMANLQYFINGLINNNLSL